MVLMAAVLVPAAFAQTSGQPPLVDRAVGDLDPLAASTRRVDPAYGMAPARDQLLQLEAADPMTGTPGQFLLQAPEFRATFTQPDYITFTDQGRDLNTAQIQDGAFIELIPPGTVFHLGEAPGSQPNALPLGPDNRLFRAGPMDGRVGWFQDNLPMDPRLHRGTGIPTAIADASLPAQQAPAGQLQPWVTAEDLREASRVEVPIPDHVVMPGDPGVWAADESQPMTDTESEAAEASTADSP